MQQKHISSQMISMANLLERIVLFMTVFMKECDLCHPSHKTLYVMHVTSYMENYPVSHANICRFGLSLLCERPEILQGYRLQLSSDIVPQVSHSLQTYNGYVWRHYLILITCYCLNQSCMTWLIVKQSKHRQWSTKHGPVAIKKDKPQSAAWAYELYAWIDHQWRHAVIPV